jgi:hypothetical protein
MNEIITDLASDVGVVGLGQKRNNGNTRVTTNNGDFLVDRIGVLGFGNEARSANNVQGCNTEKALWVVNALGLEDLGSDRNSGINRVGDDQQVGIGSIIGSSFG